MTTGTIIEPLLNLTLANELRKLNQQWQRLNVVQAEPIGVFENRREHPDILIYPQQGVPVCIEVEFEPARSVEHDAKARLSAVLMQGGKVESALAVKVDRNIRDADQKRLSQIVQQTKFKYCLYTLESDGAAVRWPQQGWIAASLDQIADTVEYATVSEAKLNQATQVLQTTIVAASRHVHASAATAPNTLPKFAALLHQEPGEQTVLMAMAIVANAFMHHTTIAGLLNADTAREIKPLSECQTTLDLLNEWQEILKINYWPIFKIASDLMRSIASQLELQKIIDHMQQMASDLTALGTATVHDMAGQIFQRLIVDRKFLATFYTLPSSAVLLAELTVGQLQTDWHDPLSVKKLRVADFSCGTGTLISAVYQAIQRRTRRAGGDDASLHRDMIEASMIAMDIMPAAVHLTACNLSSSHPQESFDSTKVSLLPYGQPTLQGAKRISLGSLDLILESHSVDLFGVATTARALTDDVALDIEVAHSSCDLVIMNPPFTRPTGQEAAKIGVPVPAFAGFNTSKDEQKTMSARLKQISQKLKRTRAKGKFDDKTSHPPLVAGNGLAGLGSNFIDLAHEKLAFGGVLGLILPSTFVQGAAWENARELLRTHYHDIKILSIVTTGSSDRAFSADTGMGEIIVIATKNNDSAPSQKVDFVNLYRRPNFSLEASVTASAIQQRGTEPAGTSLSFSNESKPIGNVLSGDFAARSCAGIQSESVATTMNQLFSKHQLQLPRLSEPYKLPLVNLSEIGFRGLYHASIAWNPPQGLFTKEHWPASGYPDYPALWSHDAQRETQLIVSPDCQLIPLPDKRSEAIQAWNKYASKLHLNRDFQLNSQPLTACLTPYKTLGGRAWPNYCLHDRNWEKLVLLWLNTTFGLMIFWWLGTRQQQGRSNISISRQEHLLVLDPRQFTRVQLTSIEELFSEFKDKKFKPANEAYRDPTRKELDHRLLIKFLNLPEEILKSLNLMRLQWCSEPTVHGGKSTRPYSTT